MSEKPEGEFEWSVPPIRRPSFETEPLDAFVARPCPRCRVAEVKHPGLCASCEERDREERKRKRAEVEAVHRESGRQARVAEAESQVPTRYLWAQFDAPELVKRVCDQRAIAAVRGMIERGETMFTLIGPTAAGKTSLAVAAYCALVTRVSFTAALSSRLGMVLSAFDLARARPTSPFGAEARVVVDALRVPVLLLDELNGEEHTRDRAVAEVLYERHAKELPTITTSGHPLPALSERYGAGIARRLGEQGLINFFKSEKGKDR